MKVRKKPVINDAYYIEDIYRNVLGGTASKMPEWVLAAFATNNLTLVLGSDKVFDLLIIHTAEGEMHGNLNGVLIKGVENELWAIKRTIFDKTYDILE